MDLKYPLCPTKFLFKVGGTKILRLKKKTCVLTFPPFSQHNQKEKNITSKTLICLFELLDSREIEESKLLITFNKKQEKQE